MLEWVESCGRYNWGINARSYNVHRSAAKRSKEIHRRRHGISTMAQAISMRARLYDVAPSTAHYVCLSWRRAETGDVDLPVVNKPIPIVAWIELSEPVGTSRCGPTTSTTVYSAGIALDAIDTDCTSQLHITTYIHSLTYTSPAPTRTKRITRIAHVVQCSSGPCQTRSVPASRTY